MGLKERFERFRMFKFNKKGFEWELASIIIAVVVLGLLAAAVMILLKGKGGEILAGLKSKIHFGANA